MRNAFPYFQFNAGDEVIWARKNAGIVNPRKFVEAEKVVAAQLGVDIGDNIVRHVMTSKFGHVIETDDGRWYTARKVLLATGAFTHCRNLLPRGLKPKMRLMPETVILVGILISK